MKVSANIDTDNYNTIINKKFYLQQNHTLKEFKLLTLCYKLLFLTFEKIDLESDPIEIERLRQRILHLENRIQKFWGFAPNYEYHTWWCYPHSCDCTYRKMSDQRTIKKYSNTCKIHSSLI